MKKMMEGDVRLVWLEAFVAVAELHSYSKAARRLEVAQSSISRHVAALQKWLRKVLVDDSMPVTLTPDGEAFLLVARQVIELMTKSRALLLDCADPTRISAKDIIIN